MNINSNSKIRVISATKYTREIAVTTPVGGVNRYGKEKLVSQTIHQKSALGVFTDSTKL